MTRREIRLACELAGVIVAAVLFVVVLLPIIHDVPTHAALFGGAAAIIGIVFWGVSVFWRATAPRAA